MNASTFINLALTCMGLVGMPAGALAQAPGQDTIVLTKAPSISPGGGSPDRPGKGLGEREDMPIGLKAKIARYTALSVSKAEDNTAAQSIVQRTESAGFNKTCVQDIGGSPSNGGLNAGRYGPRAQDQVVVLRGDFINVCR